MSGSGALEEGRRRLVDEPGAAADEPSLRPRRRAELLFGLLAFQNGFIDRDALLTAFNAWLADRSKSIGQNLVDRGVLAALTRRGSRCWMPLSSST
ncbi:MAG: hypothetical protein U0835_22185 [Isosphaeraceae bacterium]